MGGVIPTEDEARRINAAVRAYEASATSRLTSRGHVPKKRVRIEPTVASPGSTTNTLNNCSCTSAPGVITPTVTAKFSHRQAYRWKRQGLMSMLNDIDGFSVTSEPVAVWNTDTPTNSYISSDITRTVGADSDVYVLTVTEDSTHGWKLNFSIKSGASPNIADQIDWTEVCVSPNAPSPSKSNAVIVLDTETMTSEDGAYVNHPGCAGCLVPEQYATCTPNVCSDYPRAQTIVATAGSELAGTGVVQVKNSSGSWRYITNANAIAMVTAALQARPIRVSCVESETHSYSGNAFPSGSESVSVQAGTNTDGSGTQETLNFTVSYIVASVVRLTCDYLTGFVPTGLAKLEISYSGIVFAPTLAPGELPIDHLDEYITFQRINSLAPLWESPWIAEQTGVSLDLADWPVEISGKSSPSDWYIYSGTSDNEIASPPNSSYITITTLPTFTFTPV